MPGGLESMEGAIPAVSELELTGAALTVGAYLLGAVPFGLLVARWVGAVDVRREGSGNIGATNVMRAVGRGWGFVTLVLDALKGAIPVGVATYVFELPLTWIIVVGLFAILGHVFPVYLKFRGGKGVATAAGVFVTITPLATGAALGMFGVAYGLTRIVGVGSMVGAVALVVASVFLDGRTEVMVLAGAVGFLVLVRHRGNMQRLLGRSRSGTKE